MPTRTQGQKRKLTGAWEPRWRRLYQLRTAGATLTLTLTVGQGRVFFRNKGGIAPIQIVQDHDGNVVIRIVGERSVEALDPAAVVDSLARILSPNCLRLDPYSKSIVVFERGGHFLKGPGGEHLPAEQPPFPLQQILDRGVDPTRGMDAAHLNEICVPRS